MFVCQKCLAEKFVHDPSFAWSGRSRGACESCDEVGTCSDIHHSRLLFKRSYAKAHFTPEWFASAERHGALGPEGT